MVDFNNTNLLYDSDILQQISSELIKERQDIEELSSILPKLTESFQKSCKSDISTPTKLNIKLKNLDKNYRNIFFNLINIAVNDLEGASFITLSYNKIYYFANSYQIKSLNLAYKNILKSRDQKGEFTEKEFENFITKCSDIINKIVSTIIIKPDTSFIIKKIDLMNIAES